jgi:hypothetical protein
MKKPFNFFKSYDEMESTTFIPYSKTKTKVVSMFDGVVSSIDLDKKVKLTTEHDINGFEFDIEYVNDTEDEYSTPDIKVNKKSKVSEGETLFFMSPDVNLTVTFIVGFSKYNFENFVSKYKNKIDVKDDKKEDKADKEKENNLTTPGSLNSFFDELLLKPILNPLSGKKPIEENIKEDLERFKKLIK